MSTDKNDLGIMNPTTTSNTASEQHRQEQEMLSNFGIPNPPLSTKQLRKYHDENHDDESEDAVPANAESPSNPKSPSDEKPVSDDTSKHASDTVKESDNPRTLWMGDLDPWLDEESIANLWWQILNKKVSVKVIRPKTIKPDSGGLAHSGYCFVEFDTFDDAKEALILNGQLLPDMAMPSQIQFPNNPDNQKKYFRLNWASGATLSAPIVQTPEYSLFVGDLSASTTEAHLLAFFQQSFPTSVKTVRVMTDPVSGKSRCFGFVRFTDENERQRALHEMNGVWFGGRPLRVALATPRNNRRNFFESDSHNISGGNPHGHGHGPDMMYMPPPFGFYGGQLPPSMMPPVMPPTADSNMSNMTNDTQDFSFLGSNPITPIYDNNEHELQVPEHGHSEAGDHHLPSGANGTMQSPNTQGFSAQAFNQHGQPYNDPTNTTVFVGGLSSEVSEQTLFTLFKPFGIIQQIKIPPGKNCGFVKYSTREEAEEAIAAMQGFIIGGNRVRLSWGRVSMSNKKFHHQQQQVAQAAQIQAAAALSMGLDPASAIAAAAAAGGYPPPPMGPPSSSMPPSAMPPPPTNIPSMPSMPPSGMPPSAMPPNGLGPGPVPPGIPPQPMTPSDQPYNYSGGSNSSQAHTPTQNYTHPPFPPPNMIPPGMSPNATSQGMTNFIPHFHSPNAPTDPETSSSQQMENHNPYFTVPVPEQGQYDLANAMEKMNLEQDKRSES